MRRILKVSMLLFSESKHEKYQSSHMHIPILVQNRALKYGKTYYIHMNEVSFRSSQHSGL